MNSLIKKIFIISCLYICFSANDSFAIFNDCAVVMPEKSYEVGLFQPLRYSISDDFEISTHPLAFFVMPNIQAKKCYSEISDRWIFASEHSLFYPTPFLKLVAKEGIGGLIANELNEDIPHMVSMYNGILITCRNSGNSENFITFIAGVSFAMNAGGLDSRTSIDLPLVYPRLQVFHEGYGLKYGVNWQLFFNKPFILDTELEVFHFPSSNENLHIELSTFFSYIDFDDAKNKGVQYSIGCKLIRGEYPFGIQYHLLPMLDVNWIIKK